MNIDITFNTEGILRVHNDNIDDEKMNHTISIISGLEICKIIEKYKENILEHNIRYFLGKNQDVNKQMINTIENDKDWFFPYNNGITIETNSIIITNDNNTISLTNASIINGGQTVNCLFSVYKIFKETKSKKEVEDHFSKIKVLAKIIAMPKYSSKTRLLIQYVNSHNAIKLSDFLSNNEEQNKLKDFLKNNFNLFYEISRGAKKLETDNKTLKQYESKPLLNLESFNRNYLSIFNTPGSSINGSSKIFKPILNEDAEFKTIVEEELNNNFSLVSRKMLFAQFLVDAVKEELNIFERIFKCLYLIYEKYDSKKNITEQSIEFKKLREDFLFLIEESNNQELKNFVKNNQGNLSNKELNKYDFFMKSKGKYVYAFFLRILIEEILNYNSINGFELYISKLNSIGQLKSLANISKILLHDTKKNIDSILIATHRTENQITTDIGDTIQFKIEKEIKSYVKKLKLNEIEYLTKCLQVI